MVGPGRTDGSGESTVQERVRCEKRERGVKFMTNTCLTGSSGFNAAHGPRSNKGKGKEAADYQVRAPSDLRPFRTSNTFYRPSDPVRLRVLYCIYQQHFENIAREEPCAWDCTMSDCANRVPTDMVRVGPSNLLR
jgi:hypothetical protein